MIKPTKQSGFTLVEVLVTSFIFSMLMVTVSGLFMQILKNERRAFAAQQIQENGLFILELMSREIRVGQFTNQDSTNCSLTTLSFTHPVNGNIEYSLSNGILRRTVNGTVTELSNSDIVFSSLNFCVMGSSPTDNEQVRVAILASIQNKANPEVLTFNLQTTITLRDAETEFQ